MKSLRQNTLLFLISILFHISLSKDVSDPIQIDINSDIEQIYEITPDISYTFNLNNKSLAYFIESSVEDLIYYDSDQPCPKFCAIKDKNINNIYINHNQILKEKSSFKLTALPNVNAAISSTKIDTPKISGICYMSGTNIQLIQVTEKNYLFTNSYDNYLKIYFGEYYEGITISDIININTEIYKERHGEIIELNPDKIYIVFFVTNYSFGKVYLYNALPQENSITNGDNNILYLLQGNNYILNFGKNTMGFMIRLNPIKNCTLDISSDSSQKTLSLDDKYFTLIK